MFLEIDPLEQLIQSLETLYATEQLLQLSEE